MTGGGKLRQVRREAERRLILEALNRRNGHMSHVALDLGISRPTLYDLIRKLGIRRSWK